MALMKTVRMHEFGGVEVLKFEEVERPVPQTGEVLIRVHAAGINLTDAGARSYPMPSTTGAPGVSLPYVLGWDVSGEVVETGSDVTQFSVGDAIYGMPYFPKEAKAYSEYMTAPVLDLALRPQSLTHVQAAAVPQAALTAWQALFDIAQLQAGEIIFIPGGAGGVGHLAIQMAKWKGASVITTTGS